MKEEIFPGIDFILPAKGKLNAAEAIGRRCGAIWCRFVDNQRLPCGYPDAIRTWSHQCKRAWRWGLTDGWHAEKRTTTHEPNINVRITSYGLCAIGWPRT